MGWMAAGDASAAEGTRIDDQMAQGSIIPLRFWVLSWSWSCLSSWLLILMIFFRSQKSEDGFLGLGTR